MAEERVLQLRVALTASDYSRLLEFYSIALGIEPAEEWSHDEGHAVMLEMGRATLEIFDDSYARYVDSVEVGAPSSGPIRLALQVPDVEAAVARLLRHGATVIRGPVTTPWGDLTARILAPDGMHVTLFQQGAVNPIGDSDATD